jgi:citrate-Mg2+:H+ or citrate-Ca2+:H+ symporter, CitMHS family
MLALVGLATVIVLLVVIATRLMSPLVALIVVPVTAALVSGFGVRTAQFMLGGLQQTASVAAMFVFAILYFGIMTDAGMLDPVVDRILRAVGTNPTRIVIGTALLALLVHLDGSGAVTFLVTVPAMLPLYDRLGMSTGAVRLPLATWDRRPPWMPRTRESACHDRGCGRSRGDVHAGHGDRLDRQLPFRGHAASAH